MILADQTTKRADELISDVDQLLSANGQPVNIKAVSRGKYSKGLHHIAIDSSGPEGNHLIIANGIVCGDYVTEINMKKVASAGE